MVDAVGSGSGDRVFLHPTDLGGEMKERGEAAEFRCQRGVLDFLLADITVSGQILGRGGGEVYQFPAVALPDEPEQPGEMVGVEAPEAVEVVAR